MITIVTEKGTAAENRGTVMVKITAVENRGTVMVKITDVRDTVIATEKDMAAEVKDTVTGVTAMKGNVRTAKISKYFI